MPTASTARTPYFPTANEWQRLSAAAAGFDPGKLQAAIAFAGASDSPWPTSLYYPDGRYVGIVEWNESGPWSEVAGPVRPRGGPAGLILRGGRIVAEWGDTARTDMTFSVAKSYLAILAGLLLADAAPSAVEAPVTASVPGPWFSSPQNAGISWRHLLQQSSEWQGELWGKSDQVDHHRQIGVGADNSRKGQRRELQAPGTTYEYNDVRVNLLAFCLLQRFRRPLPEVLAQRVMDPIGASASWQWHGYSTSWTELDGRRVQSVSGGSHWGGGMFISARDHARFGLLVARAGRWQEQQIVPSAFIDAMLAPSPTNPSYGYLWWLNTGSALYPAAPPSSVFALGAGANLIWIEPEHDLVAVLRWIDKAAVNGFLGRVLAAVDG
jgi:CubicO group peptidase (beta-lactamase class C family)